MQRINTTNRAVDLFGPGKDGFTGGDPLVALAPTTVSPEYLNAVQEELANAVEPFAPLDALSTCQLQQTLSQAFSIMGAGSIEFRLTLSEPVLAGASDDTRVIVVISEGTGASDRIYRALDGWNFAARTLGSSSTNILRAIEWAPLPRLFVAVGDTGEIQTSTDGSTWVKQTQAASYAGAFGAVAVSPAVIVAIGTGQEVQTSEDGVTWTRRVCALTGTYSKVTYSDVARAFMLINTAAGVATSPDGITWTVQPDSPGNLVALGPGRRGFVGVEQYPPQLAAHSSVDGSAWETTLLGGAFTPYLISANGILAGQSAIGGFFALLSPERTPRLLAGHLDGTTYFMLRTRIAWVCATSFSGHHIAVSKPLPF